MTEKHFKKTERYIHIDKEYEGLEEYFPSEDEKAGAKYAANQRQLNRKRDEKTMTRLLAKSSNSTPEQVLRALQEAREFYNMLDHTNSRRTFFDLWISVVESSLK